MIRIISEIRSHNTYSQNVNIVGWFLLLNFVLANATLNDVFPKECYKIINHTHVCAVRLIIFPCREFGLHFVDFSLFVILFFKFYVTICEVIWIFNFYATVKTFLCNPPEWNRMGKDSIEKFWLWNVVAALCSLVILRKYSNKIEYNRQVNWNGMSRSSLRILWKSFDLKLVSGRYKRLSSENN